MWAPSARVMTRIDRERVLSFDFIAGGCSVEKAALRCFDTQQGAVVAPVSLEPTALAASAAWAEERIVVRGA
ncbi:MAG: hypothetical protein ABW217_04495 [Polyangiaceae bacterium]